MTIKICSTDSCIIYIGEHISEEILTQVQRAHSLLRPMKGIIDLIPSYTSLFVRYDITLYSYISIQEIIKERMQAPHNAQSIGQRKHILIPTDYSLEKGVDLEAVASHSHLSIEQVIKLHTQTIYRVYAIGFMVGFAYLGTVDLRIVTPRLSTPRAKVPKGSVAIAEYQTAIYTQNSAGGWNIIGHTEFVDFESFEVGDSVQFMRVE